MALEKILIVDDEEHILELLRYNLEINSYKVEQADTGEKALEILEKDSSIDLVVLDWMLPGIDGIEVLKRIKLNPKLKQKPVIMLTAKSDEFDTVLGLELGADDYLSKPFSIRELLARIKVILRRSEEAVPKEEKIVFGDIAINEVSRTVTKKGKILEMTLKEYELLILFVKNKERVFNREELLDKIWGYNFSGETRTVDVHIRNLRKKIEDDDTNPKYIKTVRGIGYKFTN